MVSPGFLTRAQKTKSTEADAVHAAHRACPHGWAQWPKPMGGNAVCGFQAISRSSQTEVRSDKNQNISSNLYLLARKESNVTNKLVFSCLQLMPFMYPSETYGNHKFDLKKLELVFFI